MTLDATGQAYSDVHWLKPLTESIPVDWPDILYYTDTNQFPQITVQLFVYETTYSLQKI